MGARLIQVGHVGRPHGFRGEFMLSNSWGEPLPEDLAFVYVGREEEDAVEHPIERLTEMPRGLRIKLASFESDKTVKEHQGCLVFVPQEALPPLESNQYYVGELVGSEVREVDTETLVGNLGGIEEVGKGCADRWWVNGADHTQYIFPATAEVIFRVDAARRIIWVRNAELYRQIQ